MDEEGFRFQAQVLGCLNQHKNKSLLGFLDVDES